MPIPKNDIRPLPMDFGLPIGAQYYRAPTPYPEDWERDLDQFKDYGMNIIKYWAQWRWSHPAPDEFYFEDLDRLMDLAAERELRVCINTIFDVMPAWLMKHYPDCRMMRQDGRFLGPTATQCRQIGGAPGPCLNHPGALEQRKRFLDACVARFKDHPALWLWDLWNEPELAGSLVRDGWYEDQVCYCPSCCDAFMGWLKTKYGELDALNTAWARNYRHWDEVEVPIQPHTFVDYIDWRMFFRDTITGEMRWRSELTRELDTTHPVMCHTVPAPCFTIPLCGDDDFELAQECDVFGNTSSVRMWQATDITRCAAQGKPLISSEMHALPGCTLHRPTPLPKSEVYREILLPLFRGTKGFMFWQYRAELLGREAPAWGLTRPDGSPEPWLEEVRDLSTWIQERKAFFVNAQPDSARVAILLVPENETFFYCHDAHVNRYWNSVHGLCDILYELGQPIDFVHPSTLDDANYSVIVAPAPYCLPRPVVEQLKAYVARGGRLVSEGFIAAHDPATGVCERTHPGMGLDDWFGCRETGVKPADRVSFEASYLGKSSDMAATHPRFQLTQTVGDLAPDTVIEGRLAEQSLAPTSGHVLAKFADGTAAVVENTRDKGSTVLVGCWLFQAYKEKPSPEIKRFVAGILGLARPDVWSDEVRVDRLTYGEQACLLLHNRTKEPIHATVHVESNAQGVRVLPSLDEIALVDGIFEYDVPAESVVPLEVVV